MTPVIVVLTKAPAPGRVKTRLIPALGARGAAALHEALVHQTLDLARATGLPVQVALDGPLDGPFAAALRGRGLAVFGQVSGDLGDRLRAALAGPGRRVALGTDSPTLSPAWIRAAAEAPTPVALGPAEDGGYWTIAVDAPCDAVFDAIPWSSDAVLATTLDRARAAGLGVTMLPTCYDIDLPADLDRLAADPACPPALAARLAALRPAPSL